MGPRLFAWFDRARRDLPWRRSRDPYRIWVSEVMLQQTVVAAVIGHYERFVTKYPTLAALATAEEQDVLRLWEGLGYYRRARDLLRAARILNERHGGAFPSSPEALEGVPGMGQYTRNAVLSQAFDLRLPVLEANSQRVLSRLFGREAAPSEGPARRWLLARRRGGDANETGRRLQPGRDGTGCPRLHAHRSSMWRVSPIGAL
jgi:A/G-specific adenine glycosylase